MILANSLTPRCTPGADYNGNQGKTEVVIKFAQDSLLLVQLRKQKSENSKTATKVGRWVMVGETDRQMNGQVTVRTHSAPCWSLGLGESAHYIDLAWHKLFSICCRFKYTKEIIKLHSILPWPFPDDTDEMEWDMPMAVCS